MRAFAARPARQLLRKLRPHRSVQVRRFDASSGQWVGVDDTGDTERDDLTLATYNIWFGDHHADERYRAIANLLSAHTPDVICFQEVTSKAVDDFLRQPWIRKHYRCAAVTGEAYGGLGLTILSRLPVTSAAYTHLPASVGRGLLRAKLTINGRPLEICCVHLESGQSASRLRARQAHRVFHAVKATGDVVLLGDFNMPDAENLQIPGCYTDAWLALRPDENGFTEDTAVNAMLLESKATHRRVRFDRVLIKSDIWRPEFIELLGTEPISCTSPRVFPSDHFGLLCQVARTRSVAPAAGRATDRDTRSTHLA